MVDLTTLWLILALLLSWVLGGSICFVSNKDENSLIGAFLGWSVMTLVPPSFIVLIVWLIS
jgi:hypothetical protein